MLIPGDPFLLFEQVDSYQDLGTSSSMTSESGSRLPPPGIEQGPHTGEAP